MPYQLAVTGSGGGSKFVVAATPASTINTGRPLQVEWEIEFEARRTATDWPVASKSGVAAEELLFLRSGADLELRSTGNANWIVATGVTLTNFNIFRIRTTFDGTTRLQQLFLNGSSTPIATRNPASANFAGFGALFALANDATRSGEFRYLKWTDFVTPSNNRVWDARVSNGSQTVLNETVTGATASLTNLTYSWVFYSSGGADLAANATSTSTATAALTTAIALAAAAVGVSSCTASLTTGIPLTANAAGVSSASAQLNTGIRLQAAAVGQSTATASLTTGGSGFQANATATSTATAALTTQIRLSASAVGQSSATASLTTQIRLAAAAVSQSTATATLAGTAAQLAAAAVSVSSVTANLSTAIRLAAAAYSQSTATADLSAEQVLPDAIDAYKIKMTRITGTYKIDQHVSFSFIKATPRYSITRG